MRRYCILLVVLTVAAFAVRLASAQQGREVTFDQVMTPEELKSTGVASLSAPQRRELDSWLSRYTALLLASQTPRKAKSDCDPAIETQIAGDFKGWEGETIYNLLNGQIWQQSSYHYHYHYAYAPEVTIYASAGACLMKVTDDDDQPISVRRVK